MGQPSSCSSSSVPGFPLRLRDRGCRSIGRSDGENGVYSSPYSPEAWAERCRGFASKRFFHAGITRTHTESPTPQSQDNVTPGQKNNLSVRLRPLSLARLPYIHKHAAFARKKTQDARGHPPPRDPIPGRGPRKKHIHRRSKSVHGSSQEPHAHPPGHP